MPTQVIEDPGHEFFDDNGLYQNYSEWCDFALTQEGQWRAEDRWTAECEAGIDLCIRGFCNGQNAQDGDWGYCMNERMYDSCGNLRETGLGLEYQQYLNDQYQCRVDLARCLFGWTAAPVTAAVILVRILKKQAKKLAACAALAIPPFLCLAGSVIYTIGSATLCYLDYVGCMEDARIAWQRAKNQDLQSEIDRQCQ